MYSHCMNSFPKWRTKVQHGWFRPESVRDLISAITLGKVTIASVAKSTHAGERLNFSHWKTNIWFFLGSSLPKLNSCCAAFQGKKNINLSFVNAAYTQIPSFFSKAMINSSKNVEHLVISFDVHKLNRNSKNEKETKKKRETSALCETNKKKMLIETTFRVASVWPQYKGQGHMQRSNGASKTIQAWVQGWWRHKGRETGSRSHV